MATLLVFAIDNQSSAVARVRQLVTHPDFSFKTSGILPWPHQASSNTFTALFESSLPAQREADIILLHRVLLPSDLQKRLFASGKPVVYDFDDAIYAVPSSSYHQEQQSFVGWGKRLSRWIWRGRPYYAARYKPLVQMLRQVQAVSAGNPHLACFAAQFCSHVAVVPTAVDVTHFPVKQHHNTRPVSVGWYGSPDNQWYLDTIAPALQEIVRRFGDDVKLQVISSRPYQHDGLQVEWIPWNRGRELQDLLPFDIGLMPLTDDEWAKGKSGNKAIYYMGLGIPAVVSPVGVNRELVVNGQTGFHAQMFEDWVNALVALITNGEQRQVMGMRGREWVIQQYSRETAVHTLNTLLQETFLHFRGHHQ